MFDTEPMKQQYRPADSRYFAGYRGVSVVAYRAAAGVAGAGTASGLSADSGLSPVYAGEAREIHFHRPPPLFIMLDGFWPEST